MPTTSQDGRDGPRRHEFLMRLGHHTRFLRYGTLLGLAVALLLPPGPWQVTSLISLNFLSLMSTLVGGFYHDRHLCERCIRNFPLDAPAQAAKRHGIFWLAHRALWLLIGLTGFLVLGLLLALLVSTSFAVPVLICWYLGLMTLLYITATHQRYQPWCPWCRRGKDDDPTPSPVPDPDPSITPERDKVNT